MSSQGVQRFGKVTNWSSRPSSQTKRARSTASQSSRKSRSGLSKKTPKMVIYRAPPGGGLPEVMEMSFRYAEPLALTVTTGLGGIVYRANGMFDPNQSGVGHQPYYFKQMMALYDHFVVKSSSIKITLNTAKDTNAIGCISIDDDGSVPNIQTSMERPGSVVKAFAGFNNFQVQFIKYWNCAYTFGGDMMANDELHGTLTSDPVEQQTWAFQIQDALLANYTQTGLVEIQYNAILFERKDVTQS